MQHIRRSNARKAEQRVCHAHSAATGVHVSSMIENIEHAHAVHVRRHRMDSASWAPTHYRHQLSVDRNPSRFVVRQRAMSAPFTDDPVSHTPHKQKSHVFRQADMCVCVRVLSSYYHPDIPTQYAQWMRPYCSNKHGQYAAQNID